MAEAEIMDHENPVVKFRCEDISSDSDVKISLTNGGTPENGPGNSSEEGRPVFIKQWAQRIFSKKNTVSLLVSGLLLISVVGNIIQAVHLQATPGPSAGCPPGWTATPGPSDGCSPGWTRNEDSCYFFSEEQKNWTFSNNNCSSYGASLVIPNSTQERNFIKDKGHNIEYWIDLWRENEKEKWKWPDHVAPFYIHGDGLCGYLNDGEGSSTDCENTRHWICRKPVHH